MAEPGLLSGGFYYNFFYIEKVFNVYVNSKYMAVPSLKLVANSLM